MTSGAYISLVLGFRILAVTAIFLLLGLSIDMIRSADDLIVLGGARSLAHYAVLRAPQLLATIFPIAVLIGAVLGFMTLGSRVELMTMRAAGLGTFDLLRRLVPLALILGISHNLLVDRVAAWAENAIGAAFGEISEAPAPEIGSRVAGRQGGQVVIARLASADGTLLSALTVYELDVNDQIGGSIEAARARFVEGRWELEGGRRTIGQNTSWHSVNIWSTSLAPDSMLALASGARAVTAEQAAAALAGTVVSTRSNAYYATRVARGHIAFAVPAAMLVLAALASFILPRNNRGLLMAGLGVVLGLVYVAVDGLFTSFGEAGIMGPSISAYAPTLSFAGFGIWAILMTEE